MQARIDEHEGRLVSLEHVHKIGDGLLDDRLDAMAARIAELEAHNERRDKRELRDPPPPPPERCGS